METRRVLNNAKWIILCKVFQSLMQLAVGMLCARYLGPSNYGLINYAASIVAFAMPLMKLGFDATLVHALVQEPDQERKIMGTAMVLNLLSALACMGGVFAFVSVVDHSEPVTIWVCVLYSLSLLTTALEMVQYWFQYKLMSKYSSLVMLGTYVLVSLYKIFLLITGKSVYWFAIANALDYGCIGVCLILIYLRNDGGFAFSWSRAKKLLSVSAQYIPASLMVVIFQSTDHIMLTTMIGKEENGFYTAAVTCACVVQFVYTALIDSFRPMILSNKKENDPKYERNISRLYSLTSYLSLAQSIVFTIFAGLIVKILYGADYAATVPVLQILVWYNTFSCMGAVRNVWILAEQKQKYLWIINLCGAVFNIVLNAVMIPVAGAAGAAFASLMTQLFTNFVLGFIIKPIRKNNILLLKGLSPVFSFRETRMFIDEMRKKR